MQEFTKEELNRIFSWLPFRQDWPVAPNQKEDNISDYYGELINDLIKNKSFDTYYPRNGGLGNYLEFICYPGGHNEYKGSAILVCVSLCAPIAAYGQIKFHKTLQSWSWGLFSPEKTGLILDKQLISMEAEISTILTRSNLTLIDQEFASRPLPETIVESMRGENHNFGSQFLHGLFQKTD